MKRLIILLTFSFTFIIGICLVGIGFRAPSAILNLQVANSPITIQESYFEKLGEHPARGLSGCFMTLHFANENLGWMSCLGHLWKTSDGGKTWQEIYQAANDQLPNFNVINSNILWSRTLHELKKSEDGGYTWKTIPIPLIGDNVTLDDIEFLKDGQFGWLAASNYVACSPKVRSKLGVHSLSFDGKKCLKGYVFYTKDGGESWKQQSFASDLGGSIGLKLTRDERVWAFHNLHVYYLADGKWRKVDYTRSQCNHEALLAAIDLNQKSFDPAAPVEIFFVGNTGWLSFSNGYLAKSTDGGLTWCDLFDLTKLTDDFRVSVAQIYFGDLNNGWGLADHIYKTKDGGATWGKIETNIEVEDMYFLDASHGWVVSKEGVFRIRK